MFFIGHIVIILGDWTIVVLIVQQELDYAIITLIGSIAVGLILIAASKLIVIITGMGENIRKIKEEVEIIRINKG